MLAPLWGTEHPSPNAKEPKKIAQHDGISAHTSIIQVLTDTLEFSYTSSTAQGGGGSFKNRKRIGEIDCCE